MKKVFKMAAIAASLALVSGMATAEDKIAYVNAPALMQAHPLVGPDSEFGKFRKAEDDKLAAEEKKLAEEEKKLAEDDKKLAEENKTLTASLNKKAEALKKDAQNPRQRPSELKKREDAINAEGKAFQKKVTAFEKRVADFQKKVGAFQQKAGEAQQRINAEHAKIRGQIIDSVTETVQKVSKEKGYTLVLDSAAVLYTQNPQNDLTDDVIKAFGGDVPAAPAAPATAPSEEAKPAAQ